MDGSNVWSCLRNSANNAWNANGNNGFFNSNNMYNSFLAVPLSNYLRTEIMMVIDDIITAYMAARKNKRRSADQVRFELHWEANCLDLYEHIINHTLQPTAYTFITDYPKPREVFASDMGTRVLHHYLDIRLRPLLESRMSDHTFNNRIGMGQNACQNAVISDIYEVSKGFTEDAWIVKIDMSGCFPNVSQDIAFRQLEEVVLCDYAGYDKDDLLYILKVCVFSYPTLHCFRKSPLSKWDNIPNAKSLFCKPLGVGAAIGHLIWQNAVNYYFHEIDEWVIGMGIKYERFVDDMYFVVNNKPAFLQLIPELRLRLAALGAKINEKKFYCQHFTKGVECLGAHIKMDRIYINNRIIRRAMGRVRYFNKNVKPQNTNRMVSSINSYIGFCKNTNGYNQIRKIISTLSPKWKEFVYLNRSRLCLSPKCDYTERNLIIKKYGLYDTARKRRKTATSVRTDGGSKNRDGAERC